MPGVPDFIVERLVDIKTTKFYLEEVVPSASKIGSISFKQ
jgi:hypothetical protein